jgi:D-glycero-D-manno-heptose 1,7-bisphosphate phosphatase
MARIENVLLDRDGTLIVEKHYLSDPEQVELTAGAGPALAKLAAAGIRLFVVTNQSGIGRGFYRESDFQAVQARLAQILEPFGVRLAGSAHCPHAPEAGCACRKPEPGLWLTLCADHGLDPARTAMVGDNASDVAFGLRCGLAESILVLTGHGRRFAAQLGLEEPHGDWARPSPRLPGHPSLLARDLAGAAAFLLEDRDPAP